MVQYHVRNRKIEICDLCNKENIRNLKEALILSNKENYHEKYNVSKYYGEINKKGGLTSHYKDSRIIREQELENLLGNGNCIQAFLVNKDGNDIQIQELLDNGLLIIYSFYNHKKITLFAPRPERIINLYASVGEFPPESVIRKSEDNMRKGYHIIYFD